MKLVDLITVIKKQVNFFKVLYVIILLVLINGTFWFTRAHYNKDAKLFTDHYAKRDSIIKKAIFSVDSDRVEITQLKEQFNIISEIKESFLVMAIKYGNYNFTFSMFFTVFSILSGILVFLIMKRGWDNTNSYFLKSSFLVIFFCTSLFGILPKVFKAKENSDNNLNHYNIFSNIQLDIYDLIRDNKGYLKRNSSGSIDTLNIEISSITKRIKLNQTLHFDISIENVPTEIKPLD